MKTKLKIGDQVIVTLGKAKKQVANIISFDNKKNRVFLEGVNLIKKHKKATSPDDPAGIITTEGSIHISNVSYFDGKIPVRLKYKRLEDGKKVRGYISKETQEFVQL